ncbi:MAG: response regulator [Persicimonas sp.]
MSHSFDEGSLPTDDADELIPAFDLDPPEVLVAEDDDEMRRLIALTLSESGYQVTEVEDGVAALDMLESRRDHPPYDVVVFDMWMPGLTGLELMEALRSRDWATPVVFISGFVTGRVYDEAKRLGAERIMPKPFECEKLVEAVESAAAPVWQ